MSKKIVRKTANKIVKRNVKKTVKKSSNDDSEIDDLFANSSPQAGYFNLPEGTYEGVIKASSAVIEPKDGGGHRALFVLVVTSPEDYENKEQTARFDLSTQLGVDIFTGQLDILGLGKPDSLREAAEVLPELDNVPVRFWVSAQKDEFPPKVRINERLEDVQDDDNGADDDDDDDSNESEEYTKTDIKKMSEDELAELAEELGLDTEGASKKEIQNAICEELGL